MADNKDEKRAPKKPVKSNSPSVDILIFIIVFIVVGTAVAVYFSRPVTGPLTPEEIGSRIDEIDLTFLGRFRGIGEYATSLWFRFGSPTFLIFDVILFVAILYGLYQAWRVRQPIGFFVEPDVRVVRAVKRYPEIAATWGRIREQMGTADTSDKLRLLVIEADALLDVFLKKAEYEGEHLADRLSNISASEVKSLNRVWQAHRLRNLLVHTPGALISQTDAHFAIDAYERFLRELNAI